MFELTNPQVMVATTKLGQFATARYAPRDAWQAGGHHEMAAAMGHPVGVMACRAS